LSGPTAFGPGIDGRPSANAKNSIVKGSVGGIDEGMEVPRNVLFSCVPLSPQVLDVAQFIAGGLAVGL
jgi:hypothetical protein